MWQQCVPWALWRVLEREEEHSQVNVESRGLCSHSEVSASSVIWSPLAGLGSEHCEAEGPQLRQLQQTA